MPHILELQEVSRSFKGFKLDRVSFSLLRGYIMGFIGPNGAGKTSTLKLIMNLIGRKYRPAFNRFPGVNISPGIFQDGCPVDAGC